MAIPSPRADSVGQARPSVPLDWYDPVEHRRKLAEAINLLAQGKLLSTGEVSLTANQATTTLNDDRIGTASFIGLTPLTDNARIETRDNGVPYVSARGKGTATLTHANNAQTDRTFVYVILG